MSDRASFGKPRQLRQSGGPIRPWSGPNSSGLCLGGYRSHQGVHLSFAVLVCGVAMGHCASCVYREAGAHYAVRFGEWKPDAYLYADFVSDRRYMLPGAEQRQPAADEEMGGASDDEQVITPHSEEADPRCRIRRALRRRLARVTA